MTASALASPPDRASLLSRVASGVPLTQYALAAAIALAATAIVRFPSLRPGLRSAIAFGATFWPLGAIETRGGALARVDPWTAETCGAGACRDSARP